MKRNALILLTLAGLHAMTVSSIAQQPVLSEPAGLSTAADTLFSACESFNALNTRIRDNQIDKPSARFELERLLSEVKDRYYRAGGIDHPKSEWVFPLAGYDVRAIGAGRQHGYTARGYDFFSGNRHGGHPAYDIFIRARVAKPVRVLSLTGGIVVALEKDWEQGSSLRGGRYIWVYDPANDLLVYYAHNESLAVELGQVVKPGDMLAIVGRSGFNAAKRRSPTHLHLSVLRVRGGRVEPLIVYPDLVRAKAVPDR